MSGSEVQPGEDLGTAMGFADAQQDIQAGAATVSQQDIQAGAATVPEALSNPTGVLDTVSKSVAAPEAGLGLDTPGAAVDNPKADPSAGHPEQRAGGAVDQRDAGQSEGRTRAVRAEASGARWRSGRCREVGGGPVQLRYLEDLRWVEGRWRRDWGIQPGGGRHWRHRRVRHSIAL